MSDLMTIIKERRSIRQFEDREISAAHLDQVLEAIQWAPSWANTQCWEVVVVRDRSVREKLQQTLGRNPAFEAMVQAPVVLVLCAQVGRAGFKKGEATTRFGDWAMYDLGIANQNACLAAHDLGLGTVIVGRFEHEEAERILEVPDGFQVVSMLPLGYPAKEARPPRRRAVAEFRHDELFRPRAPTQS